MNWSKSNKVLTKTKYNIHVNQLLGTRYTPTVYIYMYMYLCLYWTFLQCKTIISREDQRYGNALRKDWATSTSQSHYNSTIWVRGIASSSSSTTNASRPVSSAFFFISPWSSPLIHISRGFPSVPRYHCIQTFVLKLPDPPPSFQPIFSSPEICCGTWLIRLWRFQ